MMPRRLLKFSTQLSDGSRIKIVEIDATPEEKPYVTLSHRWGKDETCKTTTENLGELKTDGLIFKDLPRTYRDAVEVTAQLGYSYLWIDSLCILQNDEEDWKVEAPRMAVIYGNAVFTLAAMDAEDSGSGLFIKDMDDAKRMSLESRAWVMQEQMISPRSLMFTRNTISWDCREADGNWEDNQLRLRKRSEGEMRNDLKIPDHPKELFAFFRDFRLPGVTFNEDQHRFMTMNSNLLGEEEDYEPLLKAWWKLINMYSTRTLTYGKDKFLALNGIAGVALRWTQLKNTFGLWYHFIEHELLWHVDPAGPEATKPTSFRTPSWSWASLDGGRVLNRYYERLPAKPVLMIKPSFMKMPVGTSFDQGLPIPAWTAEHYTITMSGDLRSAEVTTRLGEDGKPECEIVLDPVGRFSENENHRFIPDIASWFPVGKTVKVFCLHMVQYQKGENDFPHYLDVHLVLVQVRKQQDIRLYDEYVDEIDVLEERTMRRLGYMETTYNEMRDGNAIWEDRWWRYLRLR